MIWWIIGAVVFLLIICVLFKGVYFIGDIIEGIAEALSNND
jgi:hypothetical protein